MEQIKCSKWNRHNKRQLFPPYDKIRRPVSIVA